VATINNKQDFFEVKQYFVPGYTAAMMLLLRRSALNGMRSFLLSAGKNMTLFATIMLVWNSIQAQQDNRKFPALIPLPVQLKQTNDSFSINTNTVFHCTDSNLYKTIDLFNLYLQKNTPVSTTQPPGNFITIKIDTLSVTHNEGYILEIDQTHITLTARDVAGIIYSIETLRQLWKSGKNNTVILPGCYINDYPRFAYRGMALDVSRHMFPVSFIKKYIDLLALYKFNTFHWHLTDDQGWRIEIKQYPKLQSVAAWRIETLIGHKKELPHRSDGKKYGGYYTQDEIKDIVQYAGQKNITIIPEIEMPGHALAALSAYPSFGCTGGPYKAETFWGVFDDVYCAGNDSTFSFLENVLDEVMDLFPSQYIHIGGDECPKTRWKVCPKCQQRIKDLRLKDEHALQGYFIQRIEKYVNSKGRNIIGWDEILEGGLAPNATVMSWRGEAGGIAAAKEKHNVIMTPESHLYFDYYQSLYPEEPLAAGGYTPLSKVYNYEPAGDSLDDETKSYISGVEAQAWSEYFTDTAQAAYMIFPRALAAAELAWTSAAQRNYPNFLERLRAQQQLLKQLHVNAANNFDEIQFTSEAKTKNSIEVFLQTSLPGAQIHYTTDGSTPSLNNKVCTSAIAIKKSCTLKAQLFDSMQQPAGRVFQQTFYIHKATGATVTLNDKAVERFNPGGAALVNGVYGTNRYNDNQWLGFSGNNLDAVIDLGTVQTIHSIGMRFLNYHWQRMWAPEELNLFISADSLHFTKVYTQNKFAVNGINTAKAQIKPVRARYIKVVGTNKGIIPAGEYGAGGKALLLIDEIKID
jgi:hexosaminidase